MLEGVWMDQLQMILNQRGTRKTQKWKYSQARFSAVDSAATSANVIAFATIDVSLQITFPGLGKQVKGAGMMHEFALHPLSESYDCISRASSKTCRAIFK